MSDLVYVPPTIHKPPGGDVPSIPHKGYSYPNPKPKRKPWTWQRGLFWLIVIYLVAQLWQHPMGFSQKAGPFLADVGHFFVRVVQTVLVFLVGLVDALRST
jgi:hypothetical protein